MRLVFGYSLTRDQIGYQVINVFGIIKSFIRKSKTKDLKYLKLKLKLSFKR